LTAPFAAGRSVAAAFAVFALLAGAPLAVPAHAANGDPAARANLPELVERLLPSTVNIATTAGEGASEPSRGEQPPAPYEEYFREYFERHQDRRRAAAVGSGFIIDATGYIVTNHHVIQGASAVRVIFHDGTTLPAKIVGQDQRADLAVLKVEPGAKKLVAAKWGNAEAMKLGDTVVAIGNPFGLGFTVTTGIISAKGRHLHNFGGAPGASFVDFIQTDAAINKGNSGGALFNMKGEVIGINTAIFSRQGTNVGIAFAIPSDLAVPIVEQLRKHGRTLRGWLGVQIQGLDDDTAKALGLKSTEGALVVRAIPGGPAAAAGIQPQDVILRFDGKPITNERRLTQVVSSTEIGKVVDVVVWRKGREETLKAKLGDLDKASEAAAKESEGAPPKAENEPVLGMELAEITPALKEKLKLTAEGVAVTKVDPKSQAHEKGIRAGDVIAEVDQTKVTKPEQIRELLAKAAQGRKTSVMLLVQRGEDRRFVALRLDAPPSGPDQPPGPPGAPGQPPR
jgi:serine protease Do